MQALIVSGGHLDDSFAAAYFLSHSFDVAIAADSGMEFFARHGWAPDYIVGDFDSVEPKVLQGYFSAGKPASQEGQEEEGQKKPVILQFQPEKDETDTEIAIRMAIEKGCGTIHLLGATGTRIDHVLGNIHLLGMAMERGAECLMVDPYNRVRMVRKGFVLKKEEQYGGFLSLLPVTPEVSGLTLRGLKYPLENAVLRCYHSLGVSNEITGEQAEVSFQEGVLLVVESKDD
ncbi:MAG: thiamine diphosphokinase [Lachnospiraceae bacterium]|nr:thiamine diphosphokinase [Lachnospiraceae bacterium]